MSAVTGVLPTFPPAELDRRLHAFLLDRLVAWSVDLAAAVVIWDLLVAEGSAALGLVLIVLTVLAVGAVFSLAQGLRGLTPGKAAMRLRVVGVGTGAPVGVRRALLRGVVLGAGALPTFGLGVATLAWTALTDRDRLRRGWHDHLVGSVVVDVRPPAPAPVEAAPAPRHVVNLTALRLVPAPAPTAAPTAVRTPSRAPAPQAPGALRSSGRPVPGRWRLAFDTGESFLVEGPVLVGRRPEARPGESARHLVALGSDDLSLSKTHAQLQVAADGVLVVTDRDSTNGSVLVRRGVARDLPAGRAATLLDGDVVRFGHREMTVVEEG